MPCEPFKSMCVCKGRRAERPYRSSCCCVDETYNTLSNVGFLIGAFVLVAELTKFPLDDELYDVQMRGLTVSKMRTLTALLFWSGICSAIHHARCDRWGRGTLFLELDAHCGRLGRFIEYPGCPAYFVVQLLILDLDWSAIAGICVLV